MNIKTEIVRKKNFYNFRNNKYNDFICLYFNNISHLYRHSEKAKE